MCEVNHRNSSDREDLTRLLVATGWHRRSTSARRHFNTVCSRDSGLSVANQCTRVYSTKIEGVEDRCMVHSLHAIESSIILRGWYSIADSLIMVMLIWRRWVVIYALSWICSLFMGRVQLLSLPGHGHYQRSDILECVMSLTLFHIASRTQELSI